MSDDARPPARSGSPRPDPADRDDDPLAAVPDLVRVGLRSSLRPGLRATQLFLGGAANVTSRVAGVLLGDEDPVEAASAIRGEVVNRTRESLALETDPQAQESVEATDVSGGPGRVTAARLRRRGRALLARSADVDVDVEIHPAFDAVLDQLAPDEARILRILDQNGPQPVVDVEMRSRLRGPARRTLARSQGRLGPEAGCRYPERTESYLDNLGRLGLIRVSRDEVGDSDQYEILGVQPAVVQAEGEARDLGGRGRIVRGSIELTAFGAEFVSVCLG
jgi:hypothetical protein